VRKNGNGPLYFSAQAKFFSLEEPFKPAGNEIFVRRQYFKLVNHPTLLKGFVSERVPLNDGDTVKSGERVETVLTIEAKNNYEYLLFEDLKPAGSKQCSFAAARICMFANSSRAASKNSTLIYVSIANRVGFTRNCAIAKSPVHRSSARRCLAGQLRDESRSTGRVSCAAGAGPRDVRPGDSLRSPGSRNCTMMPLARETFPNSRISTASTRTPGTTTVVIRVKPLMITVLCRSSSASNFVRGSNGSQPTFRQNSGPGRWARAGRKQNKTRADNRATRVGNICVSP
jgi:hypothetical protein